MDERMRPQSLLLHYTCHPVNVFASPASCHAVSADWPGAWAKQMGGAFQTVAEPMVLNGCCGNINPWDPFTPDVLPDHVAQASMLSDAAGKALRSLVYEPCTVLDYRRETVALDYREIPPERVEAAEEILERDPNPDWLRDRHKEVDHEWFKAALTKSIDYCRERMPQFEYEVQVFRIGDFVVVGLAGEPFVEGQLAIKLASPARQVMVAHCASHYAGYLPTRDGAARGGHEASEDYPYWAKLAPQSLDAVVEKTREIIEEMFQD
jgi:hypothetical protein